MEVCVRLWRCASVEVCVCGGLCASVEVSVRLSLHAIMLNNFINLTTISNILPYMYEITHMITETTSYKRKCGKKIGNIVPPWRRRRAVLAIASLFMSGLNHSPIHPTIHTRIHPSIGAHVNRSLGPSLLCNNFVLQEFRYTPSYCFLFYEVLKHEVQQLA